MAKIKLNGDTSGYIEISAPAVSGNNTLELGPGTRILTNLDNTFTGVSTFTSGLHVTVGSVGIGTDNPLSILHTKTSGGEGLRIQGTASSAFMRFTDGSNNSTGYFGQDGTFSIVNQRNTDMRFKTNDVERLRITSAGNIGVGIANPSQKFMVKGIIASEATNSTNNWMAYTHTDDTFRLNYNGAGDDEVTVTSGGNISVGGATGRDFSLLDGIVTNTANGSAGLLINSSSSSHNAYLGFSYGSGSSTSHADQFSAYIGRVGDNTLILGTDNNIRARVTSGGDVLIGGQTAYTYDDTGASNTILDIWNSGNNKRGILSLSGNTNAGASIGTIWFNNENNSGASPGNTMKLSAAIQAQAVTTDSNAGNDAGARLQFLTKPEGSPMTDSMIISGEGYVTKPRQPSFRAGRDSNYTPGAGADIIFNVVSGGGKHNVGNHYNTSNGRFTAPVAGVYTFTIHVIWMNLSSGQNMADCFHPKINGVVEGYSGRRGEYIANETGNGGYYTDFMTYQYTLAAGDYVTVNNQFNLTIHGNANYTTFSGHLVC